MGGSRKSRPSFLQSLVLEVDLRADAEVTTHDVRTSPGRIEAEQAIGRVGIERRLGVEQVEHVRIDGELVTDLLRHGQVKIPDILRLAVDRSLIDISVRRRAIGSIIRSEEHTSELQSLMRISYAVFCLKKKRSPIIHE